MTKKHIYIIHNPALNLTKIGITDNITRRKRQLECASGCKLDIVFHTEQINKAKVIEQSLHEHFRNKRVEGEYFNVLPEIVLEKLEFVMGNMKRIYCENI